MDEIKAPSSKQMKRMTQNIQDCRNTVKWLKEQHNKSNFRVMKIRASSVEDIQN